MACQHQIESEERICLKKLGAVRKQDIISVFRQISRYCFQLTVKSTCLILIKSIRIVDTCDRDHISVYLYAVGLSLKSYDAAIIQDLHLIAIFILIGPVFVITGNIINGISPADPSYKGLGIIIRQLVIEYISA